MTEILTIRSLPEEHPIGDRLQCQLLVPKVGVHLKMVNDLDVSGDIKYPVRKCAKHHIACHTRILAATTGTEKPRSGQTKQISKYYDNDKKLLGEYLSTHCQASLWLKALLCFNPIMHAGGVKLTRIFF